MSLSFRTYISSAEMGIAYTEWNSYSEAEQEYALRESYNLVVSYINSEVRVPPANVWDGSGYITAPSVLKWAQTRFAKVLCVEMSDVYSEELETLKSNTIETLQQVKANEVGLPNQTYQLETGINIVDSSVTSNGSLILDRNSYSINYEETYEIEITRGGFPLNTGSTGTTAQYKMKSVSTDVWVEEKDCDFKWTNAESSYSTFRLRFAGELGLGDRWVVTLVPVYKKDSVDQTSLKLHQSDFVY